jgi:hypothetical protein
MTGAVCTVCQGGPVLASRPGASPAAQVVGMDGMEILPAIAEQPDQHWCLDCWMGVFAVLRRAVAHA